MTDLKFALRQLWKNPGFTVVVALTLALGIGANTAIFSALNAILLRPLPYQDPEQLIWVFANSRQLGYERLPPNWANELFSDILEQSQSVDQWARLKGKRFILQKPDGAEHLRGMRVSSRLFTMLGVQPLLGRTFLSEENELGRHRVVILSYNCWQNRFAADPEVLNKTVRLVDTEVSDRSGQPHDTLAAQTYTIVGVMPPRWQFPMGATPEYASFFSTGTEIWEPESLTPAEKQQKAVLDLILVRLKPTVHYHQAKAEAELLFRKFHKPSDSVDGIELLPLKRQVAGNARSALPLLLAATSLVLLLAGLNVANLLLARATARQREFAIRAALGAGQFRIIRQLLTESLMLAFLGGGCGLLLAWWGVQILSISNPANLPRLNEVGLDGVVLAFALVVTVGAGLGFGLAPAYQTASSDLQVGLQEGTRGATTGASCRGFRGLLVISEVALSLVLLVSAGLLVHSFIRLLRVDTGYRPQRTFTVALSFAHPKYSVNSVRNFVEPLLERVRSLPGVESAAVTSWIPVAGGRDRFAAGFHLERRPHPDVANMSFVTADYFTAMGIPLLRGRYFTPQDLAPNAPGVKIVSESFARKYFAGGEPVGRRIMGGVGGAGEIVGVVKDTLEVGLDAQAEPHLYHASMPTGDGFLVVRVLEDGRNLAERIRSEVLRLDKDQGSPTVRSMTQILSESIAERRFQMLLLVLFSGLALLLAASGLYGLLAYTVSLSQRELGIRMALGAQRRDVLKLVLGRGMKLVVAGLLIGTAAALASTRVLARQLFGVSAIDPGTFAAVSALLTAVGLLACYIPARRAGQLDPIEALRFDN